MTRCAPEMNIARIVNIPGHSMSTEILSLGLPTEMLSALAESLHTRILEARDLEEVARLIDSMDVSCILLDASRCPQPLQDVTDLLGHTPLTTKIFLVCNDRNTFDCKKLSAMGITTIASPLEISELVTKMAL